MSFKQITTLVVIGIFIVGIGSRVYGLVKERGVARDELHTVQQKASVIDSDRARINSQTDFIADPDNLEKELRSRFNYHKPGEREIIIVPAQTPTSSTSSATQ